MDGSPGRARGPAPLPRVGGAVLSVALALSVAWAAEQDLLLQVEVPAEVRVTALQAEVTRLGATELLPLRDDGAARGDVPGDGIHTVWVTGPYAATTQVVLRDGEELLYAGHEVTDVAGVDRLGWTLRRVGDRTDAVRAPASLPGAAGRLGSEAGRVAAFGWGALVLIFVGLLAVWRRP